MTLPNSGALSFSQIQTEFGGSNPISLNEYYRGGANVPSHANTSGIPSSGAISVSNFYGKSNTAPVPTTYQYSMGANNVPQSAGFGSFIPGSTLSPNPQPTAFSSGFNPTWKEVRSYQGKNQTDFFIVTNSNNPNSGWTSMSVTGTSAGTITLNRGAASHNAAANETQWRWNNVNWNMPGSGTNNFTINQ